MNRHVLVAFFESVVFLHIVKIISPDDHGLVHLHFGDDSSENTSTDRNFADEGTLFVDVVSFASLFFFINSRDWDQVPTSPIIFLDPSLSL